jgi:phosphoribosylcarboxyaminoimidazole (NCAIR) mutase
MDESEAGQARVVLVLGPGAHADVVARTRDVLNHFGIAFKEVDWNQFPALIAGGEPGLQVVIFETGLAYTDEHLALPATLTLPVFRVVTDPEPPPEQLLEGAAQTAITGFGVAGAINAGVQAARILALNDAALRDLLKTKPYPVS